MPRVDLVENSFSDNRHTSFYLSSGPADGPVVVFLHGWPELSLSWRHQLPFFAELGFHAIAPDMRGHGRSTIHREHEDYRLEETVQDMLALLDHLGAQQALWIGHDWGCPVAWSIASHHPDRCYGVANLCVPYGLERGLDYVINFVDRNVYPEDQFPAGQWEYMRYYEENFPAATSTMDANPHNMLQAIFQKGSPDGYGQPSGTAYVRQQGWFGGLSEAPAVPRDDDVISEDELAIYVEHVTRNGFFGPNSWYMNHTANEVYSEKALNERRITMPVLFLAARYDYTCESVTSRLAEPMRDLCSNLTEEIIDSGHWMAQEKPFHVNRAMARWLVNSLPVLLKDQ